MSFRRMKGRIGYGWLGMVISPTVPYLAYSPIFLPNLAALPYPAYNEPRIASPTLPSLSYLAQITLTNSTLPNSSLSYPTLTHLACSNLAYLNENQLWASRTRGVADPGTLLNTASSFGNAVSLGPTNCRNDACRNGVRSPGSSL